jgi:signal transduction histidine kinase
VRIAPVGDRLIGDVEDDDIGGANASAGTGLRGLADRVVARDGVFTIESEPGAGTRVHAEIPL